MSIEFNAVRDPIIKYLKEIGWNYVEPSECIKLRSTNFELFLLPVLREKLKELNDGVIESDVQAEEVIKALRGIRATSLEATAAVRRSR